MTMTDVNCPYCGAGNEINHDDGQGYEEDTLHQQYCPSCEKVFVFTTYISFSYDAKKADCLNGAEHKWKPTHTYPLIATKMECDVCGERRNPTETEMKVIEKDEKEGEK